MNLMGNFILRTVRKSNRINPYSPSQVLYFSLHCRSFVPRIYVPPGPPYVFVEDRLEPDTLRTTRRSPQRFGNYVGRQVRAIANCNCIPHPEIYSPIKHRWFCIAIPVLFHRRSSFKHHRIINSPQPAPVQCSSTIETKVNAPSPRFLIIYAVVLLKNQSSYVKI